MAISLTQMSDADKAPIRSIDDIRRYEAVPIEERIAEQSIYDLVQNAAERWGEATLLSFLPHGLAADTPVEVSFAEFARRVTQTANAFRGLGVERSDAVSFLSANLPDTYVGMIAASTAGRANPINPLLSIDHIANIMEAARTKVIVTVSSTIDADIFGKAIEVAARLPQDVTVVTLDAPEERALHFSELVEGEDGEQLVDIEPAGPKDIASIFHTGGTTSAPKLIAMTHYNELATTCMGLLGSGYNPQDVSLAGLPSYHVIAGIATPLISLASGATILLCGPFGYRNPFMIGDFWKLVERHKVTSAATVPTVLGILKDIPIGEDISSLTQIVSGAAPLPTALIEAITAKTGAQIIETYGMTEASTFGARNPVGGEKRAGSVGPFVPYQEARIVQDDDAETPRDVADGEVGKILLKGPNVVNTTAFGGENGKASGEERVDAEGWLDTGDLGRRDEDGYVWLQGRAKDLIIRSGHNIDPRLIEEALSSHPAVMLVAAVGQPDGYAGEVPVAYVTLSPGAQASEDELQAFARETVSERPAAPARIEILEQMPLTAIGKIYKPDLRARAAHRVASELLQPELPDGGALELNVHECAPGASRSVELTARGLDPAQVEDFQRAAIEILSPLNFEPTFSEAIVA